MIVTAADDRFIRYAGIQRGVVLMCFRVGHSGNVISPDEMLFFPTETEEPTRL